MVLTSLWSGSWAMSAFVVYGAFNPVTTTLGQHVCAVCPSICGKKKLLSVCIVVAMDVQVEIDLDSHSNTDGT